LEFVWDLGFGFWDLNFVWVLGFDFLEFFSPVTGYILRKTGLIE
jgi:hypothetical protein